MYTQLQSVTCVGIGGKPGPRIFLYAPWLDELGFTPEALVQVLPEENGMAFILCDENIKRYSELLRDARKKGGKLIHVYLADDASHQGTAVSITGRCIRAGGLDMYDPIIVRYDYGVIRIRKSPGTANTKVIVATNILDKNTGYPIPKVRLYGEWLSGIGFIPDALAVAAAGPGVITFELKDNGIEDYSGLVKYARQSKAKLIQVRKERDFPMIGLTGPIVSRAGFSMGDIFIASYAYGTIKLQKADLKQLGF